MVASGAVLLSTNGQVLSSRVLRQALGAMFRPAAAPLTAAQGVLYGPAGTMGELTLLSDALVRVNPGVFVINGTNNAKQGQYLVPNDEITDLAVPAKDAAQFRKAAIAVRVADSAEAGAVAGPLTDIPGVLEVQPGPLAAANPALPAATPNTLIIGELNIPSVASGQPVTLTPYIYGVRTVMRGGILPITNGDPLPPTYDGQYRDDSVLGLQRGFGGAWGPPELARPSAYIEGVAAQPIATATNPGLLLLETTTRIRGMTYVAATGRLSANPGSYGYYLVSAGISWSANAAGRRLIFPVRNGVSMTEGQAGTLSAAVANTYPAAMGAVPILLGAGDYVQVGTFQDSGATLNLNRSQGYLSALYIGPA